MWYGTDRFRIGVKVIEVIIEIFLVKVITREIIPIIEHIAPVTAIIAAGMAVIRGIWKTISGLVAKKAAREVLARKKASDPPLQNLANRLIVGDMHGVELEQAVKIIEASLEGDLSKTKLSLVNEGLNQSSKAGERRFIKNLIAPS